MNNFESLLTSALHANTIKQCAFISGYIEAEYAYGHITQTEYDILRDLIQLKRSVVNA